MKSYLNEFHTITKQQFSTLGDMTENYSSSDIAKAAIDSINWYYQEVLNAKKFKKVYDDEGNLKFEPCDEKDTNGVTMKFEEIADQQLNAKKVSFECLQEVLYQSKPTIEFSEVYKHRRFEMKHPNVSVLRKRVQTEQKQSDNHQKKAKKTSKRRNSFFRIINCRSK